jgi:hypothetical protein
MAPNTWPAFVTPDTLVRAEAHYGHALGVRPSPISSLPRSTTNRNPQLGIDAKRAGSGTLIPPEQIAPRHFYVLRIRHGSWMLARFRLGIATQPERRRYEPYRC